MPVRIAYVHAGDEVPPTVEKVADRDQYAVAVTDVTGAPLRSAIGVDTDCLVVDHDPPEVDALEIADRARDDYPQLPIVFLPAVDSRQLAAAAVNLDVDAYVPRTDGTHAGVLADQIGRVTDRSEPEPQAEDGDAAMLESLLTSLPRWVSIYFKDRKGRHVAVSGAQEAFDEDTAIHTPDGKVLHSREDLLGKTDFDLYPPASAEQARMDEQRVLRSEEPVVDRTEAVDDPSGTQSYYSTTKAPWYDADGSLLGIVGITVNITEREERRRELERQNARLDRFAGVLSHDLRNPLNVARGQLEGVVARDDLPGDAEDGLDDVEWAIDRIEDLVTDTLELARHGAAVDEPEPTDLAAVAEEAWRAFDTAGTTLEIDPDLARIHADPGRLQTLLENLFRNALEHGTDDATDAHVTVRIEATDGGFAVADDGRGIPAENRDDVFEEGFSASSGGTGFGLAIVRDAATAHGWEVSVGESADGGARFDFGGVADAEH